MTDISPIVSQAHTLDYTFMNIIRLEDIVQHNTPEDKRENSQGLDPDEKRNAPSKHSGITTLKMSYNRVCDLLSLYSCLSQVVRDPCRLRWIDLSNNMISNIGFSLENFKQLSVLYMHANDIKSFNSIRPLSGLKNLTNLTLHGNPIEEHKFYRNFVIHLLPNLVKLDFSVLTKQDRENSRTWAAMFRNKLEGDDFKDQSTEKCSENNA